MRKIIIIILTVALIAILGRMFSSYWNKSMGEKARAKSATPIVTVAKVDVANVTRQYEAPARVMAKYRVEVLARISGYLTRSYFKEGDYVKAGQVLFEIEPQEYVYAANKQLARYEELVKQDYVARSEYDNILAQSNAYDAQVESAESAYRDAQRNLGYTKVKAPVDGRVGIIAVTVGNFVNSLSGALTTINSSNPMYVTFPLDSKDFVELTRVDGAANVARDVEFIFNSGLKYELKGSQDFYDNKIDETTGTITLRATFPNPKDQLIQGDFGRIIIYSRSKDNLPAVPQTATMENQEGRFVYVIDEKGLPRMNYIKTGGQTEDGKWIISSGLNEGDTIITSGLQKVIPGKPVKIVDKIQAENTAPKKESFVEKVKKTLGI